MGEMLANGYSKAYINNMIKIAKHYATFSGNTELSKYTFFKEDRNKLLFEVITPDEIIKLAEVHIKYRKNSDEINLRHKALIYLLGTTGCRIGEAINLTWNDLRQSPIMVIFRDTKNGETRYVPISEFLFDLLNQLPKKNDKIFGIATEWMFKYDLKERAVKVGITHNVYPHLFRHSFITTMIQQQCPIALIARIVGHHDWSSTSRYTHLITSDLENALYTYHPLLRGNQTFEMLSKRIEDQLNKIIDIKSFKYIITKNQDTLEIKISP